MGLLDSAGPSDSEQKPEPGFLKRTYFRVEDFYYGLMTFLNESLHLPVFRFFVDPIESRGIPSFLVALFLILMIAGGAYFYYGNATGSPSQSSILKVLVTGAKGPIDGASVELFLEGESNPRQATSVNGVATFSNLPPGRKGTIKVIAQGFNTYSNSITIGEANSVTAQLRSEENGNNNNTPASQHFTVLVVNSNTNSPVGNAEVSFYDAGSGQNKNLFTSPDGTTQIDFTDASQVFDLKANAQGFNPGSVQCVPSGAQCIISLVAQKDCTGDTCNTRPDQTANLNVYVFAHDGTTPVRAKVTVFKNGATTAVNVGNTENGVASFPSVEAVGTKLWVVVEPTDTSGQFALWNGALRNQFIDLKDGNNDFNVILDQVPQNNQGASNALSISVADENGNPVSTATVRLFPMAFKLVQWDSNTTGDDGKVQFSLYGTTHYYFTVFKDGFLPQIIKDVAGGSTSNVVLKKAVPGSFASIQAHVSDPDGNDAQLASVELTTSDGFSSGFPAQQTAADGTTTFTGVPLPTSDNTFASLKATATLGAFSGASDSFSLQNPGDVKLVEIHLNPNYGFVNAFAIDVTNRNYVDGAVIQGFLSSSPLSPITSCTTSPSNHSCTLKVRSDVNVFFTASANGYITFTSSGLVVSSNQYRNITGLLLPDGQANGPKVLGFNITDENGVAFNGPLTAGTNYMALITVFLPVNSTKGGGYLRVGKEEGTADSQLGYFTSFNQGESTARWSSSFTPSGADCNVDLNSHLNNQMRWVQFELKNGFGTVQFSASLFIKPTIRQGDNLELDYRAYSVTQNTIAGTDIYFRDPFDAELNTSASTPVKDYCYADTYKQNIPLTLGKGTCNQYGCIENAFNIPS